MAMYWFLNGFQDEIFYESIYVSFWYIMQYMDLVIVKGAFNDSYGNNSTCIDFKIQDSFINDIIERSDWSICETFLIGGKPLVSSATILNRYSDIITFQEKDRVEIHPSDIFWLSYNMG